MRIPQSGLRLDSPAWPLLQAMVTYWGITTAAGNAIGTSLVDALCSTAGAQPSYSGQLIKLLDSAAAGQVRQLMIHDLATGALTVASPWTDQNGAVLQIAASTRFVIISSANGGGSPPPPPAPSVGLWMFGVCEPGMAASLNTLVMTNLAGFNDDLFNNEFWIQVLHNANAPGVVPESELRLVTDYIGVAGTFTTNPFTANVEANDLVAVIHESIILPWLNINNIFDIVNSIQTLKETGGTVTTDGAEQNVYINNNPAGEYHPRKVQIDFSLQTAAETVIVRTYYRIIAAGALVQKDEVTFAGVQTGQTFPLKNIKLEPNRFGVRVSIERIAGAAIAYPWGVHYKS